VNLRSIKHIEIRPDPRLNVIVGNNGSGKTSILEAIHILHCGRSFRTGSFVDLVKYGEEQFAVNGELTSRSPACQIQNFKVRRHRQGAEIRVDEELIRSASALSKLLPVLIYDANSFGVIDGNPKLRRSLIDKAVFHVETNHLGQLQRYLKALQNRNQLLKNRASGEHFVFWEAELVAAAIAIDKCRRQCVEALNILLKEDPLLKQLGEVELEYKSGWKESLSLADILVIERVRDFAIGTTQSGPHKAELKIRLLGKNIARTASRGQIKVIVLTIVAIIVDFINLKSNKSPLLLIDDLVAELDGHWAHKAFERITRSSLQVFVTGTSLQYLDSTTFSYRRFHVERGSIVESGAQ
jgi:DNA replication and repair protein RecF